MLKKEHYLPLAIFIGLCVCGFFYYTVEMEKQASIERQVQMKIEQETKEAQLKRDQEEKIAQQKLEQEQKLVNEEKAKEASIARIKAKCAEKLDRNGNYLVSNETLQTNYKACLSANGL